MDFDKPKILPSHIPDIISVYPFGKMISCQNLGGIPNTTYKVVTKGKTFAVRIYSIGQSSLDHIKIEIDILEHLRRQHFISPRLLAGKDGKILQFWGKYPIVATEFIPGVMADTVPMTPTIAYNTGKLLNQFRHAMASYIRNDIPEEEKFFNKAESIVSTLTEDLHKRGWEMDISQVPQQWQRSKQILIEHLPKLKTNIIHSDFWPPNLKLRGEKIIALMDFDDWSYGPMFFDLAYAFIEGAMMNGKQVNKRIATSLFEGYFNNGGKLTFVEQALFADAIGMYCCLMLSYNIVQAPEFDQANIYLIRLENFLNPRTTQQFKDQISRLINHSAHET